MSIQPEFAKPKTIVQLLGTTRRKHLVLSRKNKLAEPTYKTKELVKYMKTNDEFLYAYNAWVESEYLSELKPVIILKADAPQYTLENLGVTTYRIGMRLLNSKLCVTCGELCHVSRFTKSSPTRCTTCNCSTSLKYIRTLTGSLRTIASSQRNLAKIRGLDTVPYSNVEFIAHWEGNAAYVRTYNAWVESGYDKQLKPTIRRRKNREPWSFDNSYLTTIRCGCEIIAG